MRSAIIPVVFTPDEDYIIPTCVAILSMLVAKRSETRYKFYIVVSNKMDASYFRYLERVKKIKADFEYQIIQIDSSMFEKQKITTLHLKTSTYYRLVIAELLKDYDKCMYHDADILVLRDLQEMFEVDLDGFYVSGIKAYLKHQETEENQKMMKEWGFPSFDNYIVAGNLVLNLLKIREDKLTKRFIQQMQKGYPSEDQDVINLCCYGKIHFSPLKFGMMNRWIYNDVLYTMGKKVYEFKEIEEAKESPAIVHFAGGVAKPWKNLRTAYADKWWEYARQILDEEEYLEWYKSAEIMTRERDWGWLRKELTRHKTIAIYGCGRCGKYILPIVRKWGCKVLCFIDADIGKQGGEYCGYTVLGIDEALQQFDTMAIVNSVQKGQDKIQRYLISKGVDSGKILNFSMKSEIYYMALAPKYYNYEYMDDCIRDFGWKVDLP